MTYGWILSDKILMQSKAKQSKFTLKIKIRTLIFTQSVFGSSILRRQVVRPAPENIHTRFARILGSQDQEVIVPCFLVRTFRRISSTSTVIIAHIRRMTGGYVFTGVCLSNFPGGVPPSSWLGGTLSGQWGGYPHPADRGYPLSARWGTLGYPHPRLVGVPPLSWSGKGVPRPDLGWRSPPLPTWDLNGGGEVPQPAVCLLRSCRTFLLFFVLPCNKEDSSRLD